MLTNWRSALIFNKLSFNNIAVTEKDIYKPIEYIVLNNNILKGKSSLQWAKENFVTYGFDFDKSSMLLWPMDDLVSATEIVSKINSNFPKLASIKSISPVLAHGLDEEPSFSFGNTDSSDDFSDINISF